MLHLTPYTPFANAFVLALPHGIVAGVHLAPAGSPAILDIPPDVHERLHPAERAFASDLRGFRRQEFTGGRLALAAALPELGAAPAPVLPNAHGAPELPPGLVGSVTHKHDLAVAIVARGQLGIGIDLEETDHERPGVAERVLRPEELAVVRALPRDRQWVDTIVRFAVKEAVYKALHPYLRRYIGFGEVAVWPTPDGVDRVDASLLVDGSRFRFEARHYWIGHRVLATVRVRVEGT